MNALTDFLRRLAASAQPQSADPREETPGQAQRRLRHLERSAAAVAAKIERSYALNPASTPTDANMAAYAKEAATSLMDYALPQTILRENWVPAPDLQNAIEHSIRDYMTMFRLQREMKQRAPTREGYAQYFSSTARNSLERIYANHLTNATEARFIALRVNAFDAHALNGLIIRTCVDAAHESIHPDAHLDPAQQRPQSELEKHQQVDQLRNYWRARVTELNGALEAYDHYRS